MPSKCCQTMKFNMANLNTYFRVAETKSLCGKCVTAKSALKLAHNQPSKSTKIRSVPKNVYTLNNLLYINKSVERYYHSNAGMLSIVSQMFEMSTTSIRALLMTSCNKMAYFLYCLRQNSGTDNFNCVSQVLFREHCVLSSPTQVNI
jgi:hypothetical protein